VPADDFDQDDDPVWVKGGDADPVADESGVTSTPDVPRSGPPLRLRARSWPYAGR